MAKPRCSVDEALAESIREVLNKDEWYGLYPSDLTIKAARVRRRLRAKGYDIAPKGQS